MMEQFSALYSTGTVRYSQTTYLELTTSVEVHRIDFHHKVAATLKRGTGGPVSYHGEHPALTWYNGPLAALTIRAANGLPLGFLEAFNMRFATLAVEWHAFLPLWSGAQRNQQWLGEYLQQGHPHTFYLPPEVTHELQALCWLFDVEASYRDWQELLQARYFEGLPEPLKIAPPFKALFIGRNYVIARDFFVSTLR